MEGQKSQSMDEELDDMLLEALNDEVEDEIASPARKRSRKDEAEFKRQNTESLENLDMNKASGMFTALPEDLVLQIASYLSASELTALAQTCSYFSQLSNEQNLWKPLYAVRWPELPVEDAYDQGVGWKKVYMDKDRQYIDDVKSRWSTLEEVLYPFLTMATARRSSLTTPHKLRLAPRLPMILWGKISQWRSLKRFDNCPSPQMGSKHLHCSKKGPYAALEGRLFMCESCGWAHLCGEACSEKVVDESSEMLVCPISGLCFDRMIIAREEDARDAPDAEAICDFGVAGHWGRAYAEGYNCATEEELRTKCGAVI